MKGPQGIENVSGSISAYTLQLIHQSDLEAGLLATQRIAQSAAIVDRLEDDFANTLKIISGDAWLPSPFYAAEGDASVAAGLRAFYGNTTQAAGSARVSVAYMNLIGTNVASFGNHEFDAGTAQIADAIRPSATNAGTRFPYLSANYDFSNDVSLRPAITADGQEASAIPGRIAGSAVVTIGGERIGVVGATTQILASISSPGLVTGRTPNVDDVVALAAVLQPTINALIATGINKIVLSSHLQQFQLETALAAQLTGVDIIISAGSHALFADGQDPLRAGDVAAAAYPLVLADRVGNPVLQVNSTAEYAYVNRLVVGFDAAGNIQPATVNPATSGVYATTDAGVAALYGAANPYAAGSKGALAQALVAPVANVINVKDGNVLGFTDVFLNGNRLDVRNQETNLGNVTADANLFVGRIVDPTVAVSIKNGGGIRDVIGSFTTDPSSRPIPPAANVGANKPNGGVSQLDIENSLRFNNNLSLVTVSAQNLVRLIEHGVAAYRPGTTPGQFPQIGGIEFSFDPAGVAQVTNAAGVVTTPGTRVRNLALVNDDGSVREVILQNGQIVGDPARPIRTITLDFQANGGDGYRFDVYGSNRIDLLNNPVLPDGQSTFAARGTEQDALAEFLRVNAPTAAQAFNLADTGMSEDLRTQNLASRSDAILSQAQMMPAFTGARAETAAFVQRAAGAPVLTLTSATGANVGGAVAGFSNIALTTAPTTGSTVQVGQGFVGGVLGSNNAAVLTSGFNGSVLVGNAGRSTLIANGNNSTLIAGSGDTTLFGGPARSTMLGSGGNDTIVGGGDIFTGGGANLVALNGVGSTVAAEGRDTIIASSGTDLVGARTSGVLVFGGAGRLTFVNGSGPSTVSGGAGSVTVFGGAGGGEFFAGFGGNSSIVGGTGGATMVGRANGDQLFATGAARNVLIAGAGNETLSGGGSTGANIYVAGSGTTAVFGGAGDETFFAGTGSASFAGGAGRDLFVVRSGGTGRTITLQDFSAGQDQVSFQGYAGNAIPAALATASTAGGSTTISLTDGTRVVFSNVGSLSASSFV
ncbi:MAG: 5'-nucleotidase C-terminal domain-containing protein [Gemmatimonadaceae bacterium]|nr:5'-nucleotidase C-terminal domain-containing protein [Acetobacteraceae bacterium]